MPLSARAGLAARDGLAPRRLRGLVGLMGGLKLWVRAVPKLPSLDSSILSMRSEHFTSRFWNKRQDPGLTSFCCMTFGLVPSLFSSIPAYFTGAEL